MRAAPAWVAYLGMRTAALRLPSEKKAFTGASYPGTNRLYELVLGLVRANKAGPWVSNPPI